MTHMFLLALLVTFALGVYGATCGENQHVAFTNGVAVCQNCPKTEWGASTRAAGDKTEDNKETWCCPTGNTDVDSCLPCANTDWTIANAKTCFNGPNNAKGLLYCEAGYWGKSVKDANGKQVGRKPNESGDAYIVGVSVTQTCVKCDQNSVCDHENQGNEAESFHCKDGFYWSNKKESQSYYKTDIQQSPICTPCGKLGARKCDALKKAVNKDSGGVYPVGYVVIKACFPGYWQDRPEVAAGQKDFEPGSSQTNEMKCVACAAGSATCDAWDDGKLTESGADANEFGRFNGYGPHTNHEDFGYGYGYGGTCHHLKNSDLGGNPNAYSGEVSDCILCKAGQFAPVAGSACIECPVGTYVDTPGATVCLNCPAGSASKKGATASTDCIACSPGQFNIAGTSATASAPATVTGACQSCVAGKVSVGGVGAGDNTCTNCPVGKFRAVFLADKNGKQTTNIAQKCDNCDAGKSVADGAGTSQETCAACSAGKTSSAGESCIATLCAVNEYVVSNVCTVCKAGKTNAKDDDASGGDTTCDATLCAVNEYVANNVCIPCNGGKTNAKDDDASGVDTACATLCAVNEYVASNVCTPCNAGKTNAKDDDASGGDTTCDATLCAVNEYVASNVCTTCAAGKTNAKDDDASGVDTTCDATLCAVNEYVASNVCTTCAAGKTNAKDDDASGVDTTCDATLCAVNEYVASNVCTTCEASKTNAVGDDSSDADTMCDEAAIGECFTIPKVADFCTVTGATYDAANFASKCATATCTKATAADQAACCSAPSEQIKVIMTVALTGLTKDDATPAFKQVLLAIIAKVADVNPHQVTLGYKFKLDSNLKRRLAAGDVITITATIAVADAAAATQVSAEIIKTTDDAFIPLMKTSLLEKGVTLPPSVTATIDKPQTRRGDETVEAEIDEMSEGHSIQMSWFVVVCLLCLAGAI